MVDYSKYSISELNELANNLLKNGLTEEALNVQYELEGRNPEKEDPIVNRFPNRNEIEYGESIYKQKFLIQIVLSIVVALIFSFTIYIGAQYGIRLKFLVDIYFGIGFLLIIFVPQFIVGKIFYSRAKTLYDILGIMDLFGFRRLKKEFRIKHRTLKDMIINLTSKEELFIHNMIDRYFFNVMFHFIISVILFIIWK